MKILELTNFSAGICGVWNRVREEAIRLAEKGHEVTVFSSDLVKGYKGKRAKPEDRIGKIKIKRFHTTKIPFSESYMLWNTSRLEKEIASYKPDVIIAHSYRHSHTVTASKVAKKIGAKSFLVTHAPFGDENRNWLASKHIKYFYDPWTGKKALRNFTKIITITKWEEKYLINLGIKKDKIEYIPNGIPEEFFLIKNKNNLENRLLFLGRISPVKDLETLISAMSLIKDKKISLDLIGPVEENYGNKLEKMIKDKKLAARIKFIGPIYSVIDKIKKIDSCKIFVLPSIREGMPQALIEAMARGKVVISSDNLGAKDIIKDGENGFLFKTGDPEDLARKIDLVLNMREKNIGKKAKDSVKGLSWDKIIGKIEALIHKV